MDCPNRSEHHKQRTCSAFCLSCVHTMFTLCSHCIHNSGTLAAALCITLYNFICVTLNTNKPMVELINVFTNEGTLKHVPPIFIQTT